MDKKNNDEKTFGEIFSNINTSNNDDKSISFNSIKEESNLEDSELKSEDLFKEASHSDDNNDSNNMTFNSIFDDDNLNFKQVLKILQSSGVKLIAIHARSAKQMYSGKPRYELLENIKSLLNIPLIVSGDIFTLDDAINALKITNADGVMIARGGVGNPHLITQINTYFKDGTRLEDATLEMQKEYCLKLAKMMVLDKGEEQAMKLFRSIGPHFFKGFANSKKIRINIASKITTFKELEEEIRELENILNGVRPRKAFGIVPRDI